MTDGLWDRIHRARMNPEQDSVTCEDCGAEFPIDTERNRERLEGGCPACAAGDEEVYVCHCRGESPESDYHSVEGCAKTAQAFNTITGAGPTPRSSKPIPAGGD